MRPRDILLAVGIAAVWGLNFIAIEIGVSRVPAVLFCALRMAACGLPLLVVRKGPGVPWRWALLSALVMGVIYFPLFFVGMQEGMPAGLTSLVIQSQAVFTMLLAVPLLRERPSGRQIVGILIAVAGMVVVADGVGGARPPFAFALVLVSAAFWGLNNIIMRRAAPPDTLTFVMWMGALSALPLVGLSLVLEGPAAGLAGLRAFDLPVLGALAYTSALSTLAGFAWWGNLLKRYGAGTVAPFSMLVPFFGMSSAAVVLHEALAPTDLIGGAFVVGGILFGAVTLRRSRRASNVPEPVPSQV
jgi:O-acetylserine/cysteine efflux transporter